MKISYILRNSIDKVPLVVWQKFLCGGRLVLGPDAGSLYLSSFLIGCPAITFCIRMLIRIREHDPLYGYGVLTTGVVLTLMVCFLGYGGLKILIAISCLLHC